MDEDRSDKGARQTAAVVAFYGVRKPPALQHFVAQLQAKLLRAIGNARFTPRGGPDLHTTIIGLDDVEPTLLHELAKCRRRLDGQADLVGFIRLLQERLSGQPMIVQYGGYVDIDYPLQSRGIRLFERSLVENNGQIVLIGWPVDETGEPSASLDELRREAVHFGLQHRYSLSGSNTDPDSHIVLGELVGERLEKDELGPILQSGRAYLASHSCCVALAFDDLAVVTYEDPRLPADTTSLIPIDQIPH